MSHSPEQPYTAPYIAPNDTSVPVVQTLSPAQGDFPLPAEIRNAIYGHLIPNNMTDLVSRETWRDLSNIADAHRTLRDDMLPWLHHLHLRTIHLLLIDLDSGDLHNRTRPHHLNRMRHLHLEIGVFHEMRNVRANHAFWDVMCNCWSRLRGLKIDIRHANRSPYGALAGLAISRLISTAGERPRRLVPRLTLNVTVAPVRPRRQSVYLAKALGAAFRRAREQLQICTLQTLQIPPELRTIEMNVTMTDVERQGLAGQYFPDPGRLIHWHWDTIPGQWENELRMTWTDERTDQPREDVFDR